MESRIEVNAEAFAELPDELREPLARFIESGSEAELDQVLRAALSDVSGEDLPKDFDASADFIEELGLDSLSVAEFVFFFEDVFRIRITNEELEAVRNLNALKDFLRDRLLK